METIKWFLGNVANDTYNENGRVVVSVGAGCIEEIQPVRYASLGAFTLIDTSATLIVIERNWLGSAWVYNLAEEDFDTAREYYRTKRVEFKGNYADLLHLC